MTLADIAGWLSLSWDTVRSVVQRRLEKDYRRIGNARFTQSRLTNSIWGGP